MTSHCKIVDIHSAWNYYLVQQSRVGLSGMRKLRCEKYNQDVDIDFYGNLPSEQREREGEAPPGLPVEGATGYPLAGVPLVDVKPCPHPLDHCVYRSRCVINRMCMEDPTCRKKRRAKGADTR